MVNFNMSFTVEDLYKQLGLLMKDVNNRIKDVCVDCSDCDLRENANVLIIQDDLIALAFDAKPEIRQKWQVIDMKQKEDD